MADSARRTTVKGARARARIVAEASRIFARDGYRAGSLAAIAQAAGLTQQGLLHYFPGKSALLLAVIEERDARTEEFLKEHAESDSVLDTFVDGVRHNAQEPHLVELMTVLSAESISSEHPAHEWFVRRYDDMVARLAAGVALEQEAGRWSGTIDPVRAARILIALADGLRLQRLLGHSELDRPELDRPELDHAEILRDTLRQMRQGQPPV